MPAGQSREKLACPKCSSGLCPVIRTTIKEIKFGRYHKQHVRRERICRHCGQVFFTVETYELNGSPGVPLPVDKPVSQANTPDSTPPKKESTAKWQKRHSKKPKQPPPNPFLPSG